MIINFCIFIWCFLVTHLACAQPHFMWLVKKGQQDFWLAGVSHSVLQEFSTLPVFFDHAYRNSTAIIPESILYTGQQQPPLRTSYSSHPSEATTKILAKLVSEKLLTEYMAKNFLDKPVEEFQNYFDAAFQEGTKHQPTRTYVEGYDAQLTRRAISEKKPIDVLESRWRRYEVWADLCSSEADRDQLVIHLDHAIRTKPDIDTFFYNSQIALQKGDLKVEIENQKKWVSSVRYSQHFEKCSVIPRNKEWIKVIPKLMEKHKRPFIIVGSWHLYSKESLLELLEKDGFSLQRFDANFYLDQTRR